MCDVVASGVRPSGDQVGVDAFGERSPVGGLRVTLFGDVAIERNGLTVPFSPGKALELFCYLLIHRDRAHTRETVSEMLWPDVRPTVSRKYLRQILWRLNTTIQDRADVQDEGGQLVVVDTRWVRVNPAASCWLDVHRFEESYASVRDTPGGSLSDEQAHDVESALELYRADLMAAWYQDWCGYERDRLRLAYLAMLDQLMGYCEARGLHAKGVGLGQVVLRHDVARESSHRLLMRLHHAAGDRATALRQYERCESALGKEFGIRPSADTTALYQQIRAGRVDESRASVSMPRESFPRNNEVLLEPTRRPWAGSSWRNGWSLASMQYRRRRPTEENGEVRVVMGDEGYANSTQHVLAELARLDVLLGSQVRRVRRSGGTPDHQGLSAFYIPEAEIDALLAEPAGVAAWDADPEQPEAGPALDQLSADIAENVVRSVRAGVYLRLVALAELFDLNPFDVEVVVMCLAPEVDRRYERLYGYLNDDVTRRMPTVDLVLGLLCAGVETRVAARARFASSCAARPARPGDAHRGSRPTLVLLAGQQHPAGPAGRPVPAGQRRDGRATAAVRAGRGACRARSTTCSFPPGSATPCPGWPSTPTATSWSTARAPTVSAGRAPRRPAASAGTRGCWSCPRTCWRAARPRSSRRCSVSSTARRGCRARSCTGRTSTPSSPTRCVPGWRRCWPCWRPTPGRLSWPGRPGGNRPTRPGGMTFVRLEFPAPGHAERVRLWHAALDGAGRHGAGRGRGVRQVPAERRPDLATPRRPRATSRTSAPPAGPR